MELQQPTMGGGEVGIDSQHGCRVEPPRIRVKPLNFVENG
jgi:hypothetical protein